MYMNHVFDTIHCECCVAHYSVWMVAHLRSAAHWAAFARLSPYVIDILCAEYGSDHSCWPDAISCFHRELLSGGFDNEVLKLCGSLPAYFDNRSAEMCKASQSELHMVLH